MNFPSDLHYTKTHEWARKAADQIVVGITDYAQHEISDIVFIDLPKVGSPVIQGKAICVVESVKAAFDIYAPVSGTIKSINIALESDPSLVNREPYGEGWLVEIAPTQVADWDLLLKQDQYETFVNQATH